MKKQWLLALLCLSSISFGMQDEDLFLAVKADQINKVQMLLSKGADVNARDEDGKTPLMHAAIECHQGMVRILIDNGADIDAEDENGKTALEHARARYGNRSYMVKLLCHLGATS